MRIHPKDIRTKNENNNKTRLGGTVKFKKRSLLIYVSTLFLISGLGAITVFKEFPLINSYLDNDSIKENIDVNLGFTVERNNNLYMQPF